MPGIAGFITRLPREAAEPKLRRMLQTLLHEPSYVSGTWSDESLGLYVAWTAHRGTFADRMPVYSERRNRVLIFSGEEYSDAASAQQQKQDGHPDPCEGLSRLACAAEEEDFPRRLNGWFQGLLVDRANGTVLLFNDRYGMNRLYYQEAKEAFYFAAEAKAILAVRPESRSIDPEGLGEFISCGCTLENRTLFSNLRVLPPASAWTFRDGALVKPGVLYFDAQEWESQSALNYEDYYRQLRDVF